MSDVVDVSKKIRALIRTLLGMPENSVRPANQEAPVGPKTAQFATVNLVTFFPIAVTNEYANEATPSTNVKETVDTEYRADVSVNFYRGDAIMKAQRLQTLLWSTGATEAMFKLGLGLLNVGTIRNLTALVDTYWEERAQLDIQFAILGREQISIPTYGEFPYTVSTEQFTISSEVFEP